MTRTPDQIAKQMRSRVYKHMLRTRGWKYRLFLRQLRLFKYLAFAPVRGAFLESYYTLMRYLDDIVDGDVPIPVGYADPIEYLKEKIYFATHVMKPRDEVEHLMIHCFTLAEKFGEEFNNETEDILNSLLFDAQRKGKMIIFSERELNHHFHLLDIRGTIRATLKVFKDDPGKYLILEALGFASRYQFDLEDLDTDISAGYINISREDCDLFNIGPEHLMNLNSIPIQKWRRHRAKQGLSLLNDHHANLKNASFSWLQRLAFRYVYEIPARKRFQKVLDETSNLKEIENYEFNQSQI